MHQQLETLESILQQLAAGNSNAAAAITAAAIGQLQPEVEAYETHIEAEAAAEEAWLAHIFSPANLAWLEAQEDVPF